jgi:folate-binding protein YgfZ
MPLTPGLLQEYHAALRGEKSFDLSNRTKIELTGKDRAAFLHNFCTNDIKPMAVEQGCEAFLCNAKGKILTHVRVFALPNALWLDAAPGQGEKIVNHLSRYIITEDVEVFDRTAAYLQHLQTEDPEDVPNTFSQNRLSVCVLEVAGATLQIRRCDLFNATCMHYLAPVVGGDPALKAAREARRAFASRGCYEILRIEACMPEYGQDIDESNYPQEVGRDSQTISFTKGCYLGQEPIVMIRDRGQVSRLLVGLKLLGDEPAPPGTPLHHEGKEIGRITSSCWSPLMQGPIALGYVRRGLHEPGSKVQVGAAGGEAIVTRLPFASARAAAGQPD